MVNYPEKQKDSVMQEQYTTAFFESYRRFPDLDLTVSEYLHSQQNNPPLHCHDFYELVLVRGGSAYHHMNGESIPLTAGNLFLVPPGQLHSYCQPEQFSIYAVLFLSDVLASIQHDLAPFPAFQLLFRLQPELPAGPRAETGVLSLDGLALETAENYLKEIRQEIRRKQCGAQVSIRGLFCSFIVHCLRHARLNDPGQRGLYVEEISGLLAELNQFPGRKWTPQSMARRCNMSVANFRLQFRRFTGFPPGVFLLRLRLKFACTLLRTTRRTLSEIALETGFCDANYFSRQFRQVLDLTPRQYRLGRNPAAEL